MSVLIATNKTMTQQPGPSVPPESQTSQRQDKHKYHLKVDLKGLHTALTDSLTRTKYSYGSEGRLKVSDFWGLQEFTMQSVFVLARFSRSRLVKC